MVDYVSEREAWIVVDDPAGLKPATWRELTVAARSLTDIGWPTRLVILGGNAEVNVLIHTIRLAWEGTEACPDSRAATDAIDGLAATRGRPALILAPEGSLASEAVARLSVRWQVRLVARIESLRIQGESIALTRVGLGGRHAWHLRLPVDQPLAGTVVFSFAVQGMEPPIGGHEEICEVITIGVVGRDTAAGEAIPIVATAARLEDARVVVAGGAGFASRERLDWLTRLAEQLGGVVGCTRPIVDKGWLPFACQIGTTGHAISPDLYVAIGISGAAQHMASVGGARHIVAINVDRAAPMMAAADLAVVADLDEFVPRLIDGLAKMSE